MGEEPRDLLAAAAAGDQAAWDALVARYTGLLWSVARGFRLSGADAGDAVQTTWLRLVEHLDRIEDPDRLPAWLATTVRRECLRLLRKGRREQPVSDDDGLPDVPDDSPPVDDALLLAERDAALWRAFDRMPDRCRTLLRVLMASPPPSYAEVSAALDLPIGSIGPTRQRCLSRLRALVEADGLLVDPLTPGGAA
jgi:RNA polymerase sigma factor (sigma-70 family)